MLAIDDVHQMPPFLMSIVSDTDLWMYVSSAGGLTAGRGSDEHAIFPYETDDKLHLSAGIAGPITLLRVRRRDDETLWEPFCSVPVPGIRRRLHKSVLSDRVIFEEVNDALGLTFSYRWASCDRFGWVRTCTLQVHDDASGACAVELLDGLLNILPAGAELSVQQKASCLINAYTQCEIGPRTLLGIYAMTSRITDRPEPAEALFANIAWSHGLDDPAVLLSPDAVASFRRRQPVACETMLTGRRGAYLISAAVRLSPGQKRQWYIAVDAHRDQPAVISLLDDLGNRATLETALNEHLDAAGENLNRLVASSDGFQCSRDPASTHHAVNVLFNSMRGGIFAKNYILSRHDLIDFIRLRNRIVAERHRPFLNSLPETIGHPELLELAGGQDDPNLLRLCHDYLPLMFARRHGDPSRPWNRFEIRVRNADQSRALSFQGNWRDLFQNWEALLQSFPSFIESIIAKFVSASTVDGFNPYRLTRDGIDWEVPDPHDPWSNIGYWGDHQIVYLLRLIEWSRRFHSGRLARMLDETIFSYADVPYRLKPYDEIISDRRQTIRFDHDAHRRSRERVDRVGGDGKLLHDARGNVVHVSLLEKLLVTTLARLSNLIPGGGIWMNTQRPEWNDANNALVGNGVSVVTLCHFRRFVVTLIELLAESSAAAFVVSIEVADWLTRVSDLLANGAVEGSARQFVDDLGRAFGNYRQRVYASGFTGRRRVGREVITNLLEEARRHIDQTLRANRRDDGLYHAYNLMRPTAGALAIERLYEMLEGQTAILSSGMLAASEAIEVIDALFCSRMYRADQQSFMLYPERALPRFLERNVIPPAEIEANAALRLMAESGDRAIIVRDVAGNWRFNAAVCNVRDLEAALKHRPAAGVLDVYERVFRHSAFTGRSGTMYGYEGLGCIYWHMVAKLLLAVQECCFAARDAGESSAIVHQLACRYYRIRAGLAFNKSAREYGAFPIDPYSHTPRHGGAKQPGMTGQVKEEILTRLGELGVRIANSSLRFAPMLLRRGEFLAEPREWTFFDLSGQRRTCRLSENQLAFTFCQVPVIYTVVPSSPRLRIVERSRTTELNGLALDAAISGRVFARAGDVVRIEAGVPESELLPEVHDE